MPTFEEVKPLIALQHFDLQILQKEKQLKKIKLDESVETIQGKRKGLKEKQQQIDYLAKNFKFKQEQIKIEQAELLKNSEEIQHRIESGDEDFRVLDAMAREMNSLEERKIELVSEQEDLNNQFEQIDKLQKQIMQADASLFEKEQNLVSRYQNQMESIKEELAALKEHRELIIAACDKKLIDMYEKSARRNRGIALGRLEHGKCSTCRTPIAQERLPQIKNEAPLSKCPSCGRILIVGSNE